VAATVYVLCAATSLLCALLLVRGYRRSRTRLLLWSSICFVGLAANNALLVIDRLVVKDVDLSTWRLAPAVVGLGALVYGLVGEDR
jgi:Family of unknown function (DUF5985)